MMHRTSSLRAATALGMMLVMTGCAVGPDFHRPPAPPAAAYAHVPEGKPGTQAVVTGADIPADWWAVFHSPALDTLVRRAIAANPDLEAARAALRQSQELMKAERGALFPSVSAEASIERARNPGTLASPLDSGSNLYTLHTAQLNVAYAPDLFGGTRRQIEASAAAAEVQRFQVEATYLTLTSNVVVAAITEASLRAQIDATQKSIAAQARVLDILRGRLRLGDAARADVAAQETLLAQTEQSLPPLQKQLAQQHDLISALTGQMPDGEPPRFDLDTLSLPRDLPLSLPAKLVDQRPDIRAAEANLHAAAAQVGVAIAARLPAITLGGSVGGSSTNFSTLLAPDNILWTIVGGLTAPLFDGGALLHRKHAADAAYDQAKAQYRSAVLAGFQNVSDALAAIGADTDALHAAERAERAASDSLTITQGQMRLGAVAQFQVLNAEQAYWQTSVTLQQARASLLSDTAALMQALGGGWWNRHPASDSHS
ncbi:MAG TPA: efflux transporter outer membrane subunit [Sphingobium sp.]|uniref:efflux transporter outer membrane subunit n=1 Tax=Sphingobium sp. TaxID=1912891 RepID=UPI002ED36A45